MLKFGDLSIRYKLTLISLLISGVILFLTITTFATDNFWFLERYTRDRVHVTGDLVGLNSAVPLSFNNQKDACDNLSSLSADRRIIAARVYTAEGKPFVTYRRFSPSEQQNYAALKQSLLEAILENYRLQDSDRKLFGDFFESLRLSCLPRERREGFLQLLNDEQYAESFDRKIRQNVMSLLSEYDKHLRPELREKFEEMDAAAATLTYSTALFSPESTTDLLGYIMVVSDLEDLHQRIRWYGFMTLLVIIISVISALLLSSRLQKVMTTTIAELATLAHQVSAKKNYSLRVTERGEDELGVLSRGFNEMLAAIEERDAALEKHRDELEVTVAERTAELKKLNKKLTFQAFHDALTNLPNRAMFVKQVEQSIRHSIDNGQSIAMLFIDLDHFKYINDTLGHSAGDRILQEVAKRLLACTRQPEDLVARLGGDEFTVLLRNVKEPVNAGIVAGKILKALALPFRFNVQDLYVTPSIGISIYPEDGKDVGSLMRNADTAMYLAKQQGRNNYQFYTAGANSASANRLHMENKLRQALEADEFEVWYQPRFELDGGRLISAEALIRWRSPELNLVPPAQFIPLAEDTGLIIPIGEKVLRTACEENMRWQIPGQDEIGVSVNLSARQFIQEDLLGKIADLLKEINMAPGRLELELTESLIMPNAEETIETLRSLKGLGIQLSVDDFGTGYSSLSYLKRFPIDILKIDQSFIFDIGADSDDTALVTAIIAMAHKLRLKVVAEGVETEEQEAFLRQHQCDYVQGYLFGKPIPAAAFRQLLEAGRLLTLSSYAEESRHVLAGWDLEKGTSPT